MALNDVTLAFAVEGDVPSIPFATEAAATAILVGEPVKLGGTGGNFVIPLANGDPEISADVVAGIAASASNHTATANGLIQVFTPVPGSVWRCKATTPANMNTIALLTGLLNDRVAFDLTGAIYTVDENEGDDVDHGLRIVGGDIATGDMLFVFRQSGVFTN